MWCVIWYFGIRALSIHCVFSSFAGRQYQGKMTPKKSNRVWKWELTLLCLIVHSGRAIEVNMSGRKLTSVPRDIGSNVTKLNLARNKLNILDDNSFQTLVELLELNLETCHIKCIYNGTFAMQGKLQVLSLKYNEIHYLPVDFGPPTDSLLTLNTFSAFADILDLKPFYFSAFKKLERLRIGGWAGIPFSKAHISMRLTKLSAQYAFKTFPDLSNLTKIKTLNLYDHAFSFIPDEYIRGMDALKFLAIGRTNLEITPDLSHLENLNFLWLISNSISRIPRDKIEGLGRICELQLQDNELTAMPNISHFPLLQVVRLDSNRIPSVPHHTLYELPKLYNLDLTRNMISHIEVSSLFMSGNLFLGGNQLTNPPDLFDMTLDTLHISDNPLLCDHSLCWLRMWPWFKSLPNMDNPVCAQPAHMRGTCVMRVHPVLLQCYKGL